MRLKKNLFKSIMYKVFFKQSNFTKEFYYI